VDSFPMTTGKIQKFQIREKMKQTLGLLEAATA
jgi:fatty-acyl-CoA synthase